MKLERQADYSNNRKELMKAAKFSLLIAATVAIASIGIAAEKKMASPATDAHKVYDAGKLEWGPPPPGFPAGAQAAVLYGNPGEKGVYTVRLKAPAGYKIMPHTHPTAELVTVISGGFHVGMGDKFDESAGEAMTAGGFVSLPAKMPHFAWCTEESVIQVHGEGPFVINYVNPADDPRNAKK